MNFKFTYGQKVKAVSGFRKGGVFEVQSYCFSRMCWLKFWEKKTLKYCVWAGPTCLGFFWFNENELEAVDGEVK